MQSREDYLTKEANEKRKKIETAQHLRKEGKTILQIAKILNCSKACVYSYLSV